MNRTYEQCTIQGHDDEFLNMVCIDEACPKHQLLCSYCIEEHQNCRKQQIRKFLLEFRQQLNSLGQEVQGPHLDDLLQFYDQVKGTLDLTQKVINDIFEKTKQTILDSKKIILQMSTQVTVKQQQEQKLKEFEALKNQENFWKLLAEIESFKVNPEKFCFTVRKPQSQTLDKIGERLANAKICAQQYQSAMNTFTEQFLNQQKTIEKNLSNFFINAPQRVTQQEVVQDGVNFDKFKSNQIYTPIQQQQQVQQVDRSIIAIDDDLDELALCKDPLSKDLLKKNGSAQKQLTPVSISDILESDDKKITPKHNNLPSLAKRQNQQQPNLPKTTPQPPLPQQTLPPPPPAQPQSPIAATQDENQNDVETVLNVSQESEFQMLTNGKDILKLIFLNRDTIAGIGGNQLQVFHALNGQRLYSMITESEITDIGYLEIDDYNGTLYVATKRGKIETYQRENAEQQFQFRQGSIHQVDKPGMLFVSINQQDKAIITLGEEKVIKIWSVKTLKDPKRQEVTEFASVLHTDQKQVFVGGMKFLLIYDYGTNTKKMIAQESKVIGISTHETKLVVGLQEQIKVYEMQNGGEPLYQFGQKFGMISSMQILKKWPIVLVSSKQSQPRVFLYNYEQDSSEKLNDQLATYCAVREYDKVYYVAFGKEKGGYLLYRIEQTVPQSL